MKVFWLLACILLAQQLAHADTWQHTYLGGLDDGESIKINWDSIKGKEFISSDGYFTNAQIKRDYTSARRNQQDQLYYQEITYWYADCANNRYQLSDISWHNRAGDVIGAASQSVPVDSSSRWKPVTPSDPAHDVYHWICWAEQVKATQS